MTDVYTEVKWLDSGYHIDLGWATAAAFVQEAKLENMEVVTVGIVMHEDDDLLLIGQSHAAEDDDGTSNWYATQAIAKQNIISRKALFTMEYRIEMPPLEDTFHKHWQDTGGEG